MEVITKQMELTKNNTTNNNINVQHDIDLNTLQHAVEAENVHELPPSQRVTLERVPEVMDDFIRNFLVKHHMLATLAQFEQEWYARFGPFTDSAIPLVPDHYQESMALLNRIEELEQSLRQHAELTSTMSSELATAQRERDFHRGSHNRVVQEKQRLTKLLKQVQSHVNEIEPTLEELRKKNESLFKSKSLLTIERDRLASRVCKLEEELHKAKVCNYDDNATISKNEVVHVSRTGNAKSMRSDNLKSSKLNKIHKKPSLPPLRESAENDTFVEPADDRSKESTCNSDAAAAAIANSGITSVEVVVENNNEIEHDPCKWVNRNTFTAHSLAITKMSLHPHKPAIASCSDDGSWQLHALPAGNRIAGATKAHHNWIADVEFNTHGTMLATASGDSTVKLWSLAQNNCLHVLRGHTDGCWSVCFQDTDHVVASGSLDSTARIWDVEYGKCRQTLRGHSEAVNVVQWMPQSNLLCTGSADKTISLWDARMNTCVSTMYGHPSAILSLCLPTSCSSSSSSSLFSSETIISSDAQGVVMVWDVRRITATHKLLCGKNACNHVDINSTNSHLAMACDDGSIKIIHWNYLQHNDSIKQAKTISNTNSSGGSSNYSLPITVNVEQDRNSETNADEPVVKTLRGHDGPVQCVLFDQTANQFLVSCGSDGTIRYWCEE